MHAAQWHEAHSHGVLPSPAPTPRTCPSAHTDTVPIKYELPSPLLQPLTPTVLLPVPVNLVPLGTSCAWHQIVFALLWLGFFTEHRVPSVHPRCSLSEFPSFLRLSDDPPCEWPTLCASIHHGDALGLFPPFGDCEWCCREHRCASICSSPYFHPFEDTPGVTESFCSTFRGAARLSPQQL